MVFKMDENHFGIPGDVYQIVYIFLPILGLIFFFMNTELFLLYFGLIFLSYITKELLNDKQIDLLNEVTNSNLAKINTMHIQQKDISNFILESIIRHQSNELNLKDVISEHINEFKNGLAKYQNIIQKLDKFQIEIDLLTGLCISNFRGTMNNYNSNIENSFENYSKSVEEITERYIKYTELKNNDIEEISKNVLDKLNIIVEQISSSIQSKSNSILVSLDEKIEENRKNALRKFAIICGETKNILRGTINSFSLLVNDSIDYVTFFNIHLKRFKSDYYATPSIIGKTNELFMKSQVLNFLKCYSEDNPIRNLIKTNIKLYNHEFDLLLTMDISDEGKELYFYYQIYTPELTKGEKSIEKSMRSKVEKLVRDLINKMGEDFEQIVRIYLLVDNEVFNKIKQRTFSVKYGEYKIVHVTITCNYLWKDTFIDNFVLATRGYFNRLFQNDRQISRLIEASNKIDETDRAVTVAFHKTYESKDSILDTKKYMMKLVQDLDIESFEINTKEREVLDIKEEVDLKEIDENNEDEK